MPPPNFIYDQLNLLDSLITSTNKGINPSRINAFDTYHFFFIPNQYLFLST